MTAAWTPRAAGPLAYAAALVLAVALTGCASGGSTPPVPSPTSTTPPASTSSPPPTPSATTADPVIAKIPAAARPNTQAGAEAYARFFLESLNRGAREPDPTVLTGLFNASCKTCQAMYESLEKLKAQGRRHSADTIQTIDSRAASFVPANRVIIVDVEQRAVDVVDASGRKVNTTLAAKGQFACTLAFIAGHWEVQRLQTVAK